jgi:hypothetical protein
MFEETEMLLHDAAARVAMGELVGGDEGRALVAKARGVFEHQGIVDRRKMRGCSPRGSRGTAGSSVRSRSTTRGPARARAM